MNLQNRWYMFKWRYFYYYYRHNFFTLPTDKWYNPENELRDWLLTDMSHYHNITSKIREQKQNIDKSDNMHGTSRSFLRFI